MSLYSPELLWNVRRSANAHASLQVCTAMKHLLEVSRRTILRSPVKGTHCYVHRCVFVLYFIGDIVKISMPDSGCYHKNVFCQDSSFHFAFSLSGDISDASYHETNATCGCHSHVAVGACTSFARRNNKKIANCI